MNAPTSKTFCVRFLASSGYKISLRARSEAEAVAKARRLWESKGEEPFTCYSGDTDGWVAFDE